MNRRTYEVRVAYRLENTHPNHKPVVKSKKNHITYYVGQYVLDGTHGEDTDEQYIINDVLRILGSTELSHYAEFDYTIYEYTEVGK